MKIQCSRYSGMCCVNSFLTIWIVYILSGKNDTFSRSLAGHHAGFITPHVLRVRMPVPGYDPEDIDSTLESLLDADDIAEILSEEERQSYQDGDANLVDLLESGDINRIFQNQGVSVDSDPSREL